MTVTTKVKDMDGEVIFSLSFPINREVIQGDIVSSLCFVFVLELMLYRHDRIKNKGVNFGGVNTSVLGIMNE